MFAFRKSILATIAASLLSLPLLAGCSFDADAGHHDRDRDWGRPAGYRYDHDRDWDHHDWHDRERDHVWHDRD